jgi:hypothetical protein
MRALICFLLTLTTAALRAEPVGVNLAAIRDWSTAWPFVDAFKTARAWISHPTDGSTWDDGRPIDTTPEGWVASLLPGQNAGTLLFRDTGPGYPAGQYLCLYEGTGQLEIRFDAAVVSSTPGRLVLDVTPSEAGIHLVITQTDPADPIRNIRVIMPGFEDTYETQIFHPEFLESLEPFAVLRFMDWMDTNNSYVSAWDERAKLTDASWALGRGVPVEIMAELCNRLDADAWFCMPHLADDDFVARFAQLAEATLDPDRRVYIEHSNEVWNGIFTQSQHAQQQAAARGIPGAPFQAGLRYHAERSVEIFDIFDDVFPPGRLVRVLAGQHANPWTGLQIMDWQNAADHADAYATAPYFGGSLGASANAPSMSVAEMLEACRTDLIAQRDFTADNLANAEARGLELIAYEGGQHLAVLGANSGNQQVIDRFIEANRDPFMRQLYRIDLEGWRRAGGGLFCSFSHITRPGRYGSWGMLEHQTQPRETAPKWLAVTDHIAGVSCPADFNIDARVDFADVTAFLIAFAAADPLADLVPDATLDFSDIQAFIVGFLGGCD